MNPIQSSLRTLLLIAAFPTLAIAQWDPSSGQWGKEDGLDVRVMTYNVQDGLCSTNPKVEGQNNWCAIARTIAALKPDVLLLQECGDNNGNGTGGSSDSPSILANVIDLLLTGGTDPYLGGTVTSYVAKYAPGFDMPFIYVTSDSDGFNRNVIVSRYPYTDLNGDTRSTYANIPFISADQYSTGGDGGLRGIQLAEIDLPDGSYPGDLVVANMHLKAGGGTSNHDQRIKAAQNLAYILDYWYNGAGTGFPDPNGKISDSPAATQILDGNTPIVIGGDWNEDEITNGTKGPADWMTQALLAGGSDGTDRDGSDMTWDSAVRFFTGSDNTQSGSKLDYIAHQDSIIDSGVESVFDSNSTPLGNLPAEFAGFSNPSSISSIASDHKAIIVDFRFSDTCGLATNFCVSTNNSGGTVCDIGFTGTSSIASNDLSLTAVGAPASTFGIFFYGAAEAFNPFGDGFRCVGAGGAGIFRLPPAQMTNIFGELNKPLDYNTSPMNSGAGQLTSGATWYFQFWYRDVPAGASGFNLSNGLSVTFCP
ncbi:MAG: endonuclease/exonuclease/phosphatase family metal-dependent hydrolase [Planctomycetota bacterium]|jgi:endonuclease/exonuclease/phosphatase family metal-dependent hydrolase